MLLKVAQDAVNHLGLSDKGDDLHLRTAFTKQWICLVDAANHLRPGPPLSTRAGLAPDLPFITQRLTPVLQRPTFTPPLCPRGNRVLAIVMNGMPTCGEYGMKRFR